MKPLSENSARSCKISGKVSREVLEGLKRYGRAFNLGTKDGDSVLTSIGATVIYLTLKEVENNLKIIGKSIEDMLSVKDSYLEGWSVRPIFATLKDKDLLDNLPNEIMSMVLMMSRKEMKGGGS